MPSKGIAEQGLILPRGLRYIFDLGGSILGDK